MLEDKRLDKDVPIPLYFQLEKLILEEIDNGNYPVGSMIPTEMELSQMFGISRTTVRQAISDLVREEHLYRIKSKGTFVAHPKLVQGFIQSIQSFDDDVRKHRPYPQHRGTGSQAGGAGARGGAAYGAARGHQGHLSLPQAVCRRRAHRPGGDLPAL
ncbi:MAG: GntR family transcriptional regulator [Flavonifractor plautii]